MRISILSLIVAGVCILILSVIVAGVCLRTAGSPGEWRPAEVRKISTIVSPKDRVPNLDDSVITTPAGWKEIWGTLAPDQEAPDVDFGKNLVLVRLKDANDPNEDILHVRINNEGQLQVSSVSTLIGFEPSNILKVDLIQVAR